jgi:zinc transport system permease protein
VNHIIELLALAPVQRGLFAFLVGGLTFPIVGVFIVVLDLVTLRFTLMHGALLGGVLGLLFGVEGLLFPLLMTTSIAILIGPVSNRMRINVSNASALFMIVTIALAFLIIDKAKIAALDAFSVFWGSIFALSSADLLVVCVTAVGIAVFLAANRTRVTAVLFDRDIAFSVGVSSVLLSNLIVIIAGIVIAVSMKLIGALLVDCLVILPALGALSLAKSMKQLFAFAAVLGFASSLVGFVLSLAIQIQPSQSVTFVAVFFMAVLHGKEFIFRKRREQT